MSTSRGVLLLSLVLLAAPGWWKRKPRVPVDPVPDPGAEIADPPAVPTAEPLFDGVLPLDIGPLPDGLANPSAQGCNACHFSAHDGWAGSAHATGWQDSAFAVAATEAATPVCWSCHLPLLSQWTELVSYDQGDPSRPVKGPNPGYDATLHTEGVTCAACHIRDGAVIASRAVDGAPHPVRWTPMLTDSSLCGACHQLTWPGADKPFYDTYGEWERSPQGRAGLQCMDCHMGPGAASERRGTDHGFSVDPARAVSVLVRIAPDAIVRGGDSSPGQVRLQNTGAGHAFPTGSPFRQVELHAFLEGPPAKGSDSPTTVELLRESLGRTMEAEAPWRTIDDTRLQAGGERSWSFDAAIEQSAPAGSWFLVVVLREVVRETPASDALVERRIPLRVE